MGLLGGDQSDPCCLNLDGRKGPCIVATAAGAKAFWVLSNTKPLDRVTHDKTCFLNALSRSMVLGIEHHILRDKHVGTRFVDTCLLYKLLRI